MDWLRNTYSAPCRFHDDPAAPLGTITWMWTDQPFQSHESAINSKHWQDAGERETVVGEQWVYPPRTRALDLPIGVTGGHECGERGDFENGQSWPVDGEPVEYDEDGIPLCCPRYHGLTVPARPKSDVSVGDAVPEPGPDCAHALSIALDTVYAGTIPDYATNQQWWTFGPVLAGQTYHLVLTCDPSAVLSTFQLLCGSCGFNTIAFAGTLGDFTLPFTITSNGDLYLVFIANFLLPGGNYTLKLTL